MALRIEISKMYNGRLELRIGDLSGSTTLTNISKGTILLEIGNEIDKLLEESNGKVQT